MRLFDFLYKWVTGSKAGFLGQYGDNQELIDQASVFWNNMEGLVGWWVLIFVILGVFMAVWYYKPFNEKPGRHYRPRYWFIFLISTCVLTIGITLGLEYIAVRPSIRFATGLEVKIALVNGLYGVMTFIVVSIIWCNFLPTNAYKLLKF